MRTAIGLCPTAPPTAWADIVGEIIDAMAESSSAYEDAYLAQWEGGQDNGSD